MIFRKLAIFVVIFSTKKLFLNPYLLANVGHIWNCCGALLSLKEQLLDSEGIMAAWIVRGDKAFNQEQQQSCPVILKFACEPIKDLRDSIRLLGLKWNKFRGEWYGHVTDLDTLKTELKDTDHEIEVLN